MARITMKVSLSDLIEMDIDDLNNEFDNNWRNHPKNKNGSVGMSMGYEPIKILKDDDFFEGEDTFKNILLGVDFEDG